MRSTSITFSIGVISLLLFHSLPNIYWILGALVIFIIYFLLPKSIKKLYRLPMLVLLGFSWVLLHAYWQLHFILPKVVEDKDVIIQGYVASIPEHLPQNTLRFEFELTQLQQDQKFYPSPHRIRLTWEGNIPNLKVGDEWQLQARLKQPRGTMNPGGFDYEAWLFANGIRATGYVRDSTENHLLQSKWIHHPIDRLRQSIAEKISQDLQGNAVAGLITALSVGVRDNITTTQWQTLRGTGTNHLMAIAGLHIGLIAGIVFFLVNFIWRRFLILTLRTPAPQAGAIASLIAAIIYSALAGFALPTERAVIMLAVFLLSILLRRNLPPWNACLLALFIILIIDPLAPLSSSFWLSFAAVSLIIYGISNRIQPKGLWWKYGRIQWVIAIGLIPLTLLFFQQISLAGFLANMIAIPVVGFIILPLSFSASLLLLLAPHLGNLLLQAAAQIMSWFWPVLEKIATTSWLQWHAAIINGWILVAAIIGILLLLAPRGIPARWLGLIWLLPMLFWKPAAPEPNEVWFTLLDVGQGLASVVRTQHHVLIYDTGPRFNDNFDMGDSVVVPYLRTLGIRDVDMMVISHGDNDHIGGAQSVMAETQVKQIVTSRPERFAPGRASSCLQGQSWQWDGVNFQFLYPPQGQPNLDNDSSCVLKITVGKNSLLLTGDIEKKSENYLLQNESSLLKATILVAPHHGSITSSTPPFVKTIAPQYVLFPVGYLNRYHFPNPRVLTRYAQIGALHFDSVTDGAVSFKITPNLSINLPTNFRIDHHHYWNL